MKWPIWMHSFILALADNHLFITDTVSLFRWLSAWVVCLISSTFMHSGISVHVLVTLMFKLIHVISSSLPSLWLCLYYQSAMFSNSCGLYRILILHWCICSRFHFNLGDRVATSCLKVVTSVTSYHLFLMGKTLVVKFLKAMQYALCSSFYVAGCSFCTWQVPAYKCYRAQQCVVRCIISWEAQTIPGLYKSCPYSYRWCICLKV